MKTSKIKEIISVNEWTKWEHWPVFYFNMKMENGETIKLWKKKQDAFKVWDTVSYEENGEWRWKEIKEQPFVKKYNAEANTRWAMIWMAIKLAFDKVYEWPADFDMACVLSKRIFWLAMEMYWPEEKSEEKEQEKESAKDDKLPF